LFLCKKQAVLSKVYFLRFGSSPRDFIFVSQSHSRRLRA
jgi:hypothetical protein